jgi:lipoprotein signal peptidase
MDENELETQNEAVALHPNKRRRDLLPWWVIGSIWLFFLFTALIPVGIILGMLKYSFKISLLGLETSNPFSVTGLFLILIFIFKAITAFGLWAEKKWGVGLAKIDAVISIAICCLVMAYPLFAPGSHMISIRLELIILIPYYYKMNAIQYDWKYFDDDKLIDTMD